MALVPTSSILSNVYSPSSIGGLTNWYDMFTDEYVQYNLSTVSTLLDKSGGRNIASSFVNGVAGLGRLFAIYYVKNAVPIGGGCLWFQSTSSNWINIPDKTRTDWSWFVLTNAPAPAATSGQWSAGRGILDNFVSGSPCYGMSAVSNALACGVATNLTVTSTIYISSFTNPINAVLPNTNNQFNICEFHRSSLTGYIEARLNGGTPQSTIGVTGIRPINTSGLALGTIRNAGTLNYSNIRFYEILMYSTIVSPIDRQQIEGYLAWKWGFPQQLAPGHPYRNNPYILLPDPTPTPIPNNSFLVGVDTYSSIKTLMFPSISENIGRSIVIKDYLGSANRNPIYISTQGADLFQDLYSAPTDYGVLSTSYGAWTFQNDGISRWFITSEYNNTLPVESADPPLYPSGPKLYLDPATSTFFPTFTTSNIGTTPQNMRTFLNFSGTGNQFIDFGPQTFNFSINGFAVKTKILFTQIRAGNLPIFNFNNGPSTNEIFLRTLTPGTPGSFSAGLEFGYRSLETLNAPINFNRYFTAGFSTNYIYNITLNYFPDNAAYGLMPPGRIVWWVNGYPVLSNVNGVAPGIISSVFTTNSTFIARPALLTEVFSAFRMYKFALYERALSDAECAYQW